MDKNSIAIELSGISKSFGSVVANDKVNLSLKKGEILALLGENGSGKTTLMNMLSGIYKPDSGEIKVNGEVVSINTPEDSKILGIGMVHQHFKLVERFSAADNILIGDESKNDFFLKKNRFKKIQNICDTFGFSIDVTKKVCDMSVSEKQTVEIIKVLYYGADILILDEPTAVLTVQETRRLFSVLRKMSKAGCSIIIITHKLNEVLELSDRVTILRKGQTIDTVVTSETNAQELTNMMVGRAVELAIDCPQSEVGDEVLTISNLCISPTDDTAPLDNVSFSVRSGEIVGIAGVSGSGQKELCEAIAGLQKCDSGDIFFKGEQIKDKSPREIIKKGVSMSFVPEDRLGMGLAASLSITDNLLLKKYSANKGPFVDRHTARQKACEIIERLEVNTPGTETPVRRLSGGNVQKILLGREIDANPSAIVTAYPVRGLDINSSYTVYNILNEQKQRGVAIMFVGEDLDVMLELCDRIVVICHGKVTGIVNAKETTKEELGLLMTDALAEKEQSELSNEDIQQADNDVEFSVEHREKTVSKKVKKPLLRIVKRDDLSKIQTLLFYIIAILGAIVTGGIFVAVMGTNPFEYYKAVVVGCFNNPIYFRGFVSIVTPLLITSLGVSFAFKMKFWNIGANGQFIVGAIFAATTAIALGDALPQWLTLIVMAIVGGVAAGLFGLIPAVLKVKFGTNETLLTLMLNYIAYYILTYLKNMMFFRKLGPTGEILRPDFKAIPQSGWIYTINIFGADIDISIIIGIILVLIVAVYFKSTKGGYEINIVGDSQNTARYAGMNVNKIILKTMFVSAAIVGVAGMLHLSGTATGHMLSDGITSDVGWTAIIVAWLAKLNAFGIFVGSALMGVLQKGTAVAESAFKVSSATSDILEGVVLFTILAADFFIRYRVVIAKNSVEKEVR